MSHITTRYLLFVTDIYNGASSASIEEKRKWSFKNHFVRRKSTSLSSATSSTPAPLTLCAVEKEKETATFYLTLTIETDKREAALAAAAAEASQRLKGMNLRNVDLKGVKLISGRRDLKSVLELGRISNVGVVERPKSCMAALDSKGRPKYGQRRSSHPRPVRPKNAPPAPPSGELSHFH